MAESFVAGFAYGATTVLVGQPLDTIKTLQQTSLHDNKFNNASTLSNHKIMESSKNGMKGKHTNVTPTIRTISKHLYATGGIPAFYRGGLPLLLGGGLMRSAQFGVYKTSLNMLKTWDKQKLEKNPNSNVESNGRICFGIFDPNVIIAGFFGGIGRGMVEGPFEMIKVRRQVQSQWNVMEIMKGSGTTLFRNAGLFMSFAIYMDLYDQLAKDGLSPFWKGGICANLAWLTIWREYLFIYLFIYLIIIEIFIFAKTNCYFFH